MKTLLVIISQSPLQGQLLLESLSAVMVLATYGIQVKILLTDDGVDLLRVPFKNEENTSHPFKSAHALVESFEFYDLLPVWVDQISAEQYRLTLNETIIEHEFIELNSAILGSFDGVLRW
ncbi:DsrE family protein [Aquirhabdus sp.]|uniref:DsrE family protein n=1 Tax=Aquirhabdus sp. TaxID=2824160 RepID=UPI00396D00FF